jgi:hypothetical protein
VQTTLDLPVDDKAEARIEVLLHSVTERIVDRLRPRLAEGETQLAASEARVAELKAALLNQMGQHGSPWAEGVAAIRAKPDDDTALREFGLRVLKLAGVYEPVFGLTRTHADIVTIVLLGRDK